ncbi:MAG TPA: extracellular solute-binding protein [Geminicoccaceae bacterium]|nr:extracellular solute-binding protein [Geminicoccaceae bacterium]
MKGTTRAGWLASAAAFAMLAGLGPTGQAAAQDIVLKMAVPDWPPTRIMQDLANEQYRAASGNNVRIEADFIPWPNYYERLAASLTSGEKKYQMAVSDSQWLGAFVEGGYFMKINEFIENDPEWQAIFKDLHPNVVAAYSTYPHKSENYYGFPQMPDVLVTYYREDVFCHEDEQKAYQERYGAKLPCTGDEMDDVDWDQVKNFGEFFRRGSGETLAGETLDDDFYGIAYQAGKDYDFAIMQVNGFIWQHGADIWDETKAPDGQAEGVVNSPEAVAALEHYLELTQYMPPVVKTGTMDVFKTDELFREGKVAWIVQWIGFGESTISPQTSKVADKAAFALPPGLRGSDGNIIRWQNIGGQPFVLTTWNSDEVTQESLAFCKWWLSEATQTEFAKRGGQSALRSVYEKPDYVTFRPWNRAWGPSLDWQKDVWHVPDFFELLVQSQEEYVKAITGQQDAKTTMDNIAAFQQRLLTEAGLIK